MAKRDPVERFLEKFDIGEIPEGFDSPCFVWVGTYGRYGYKPTASYGHFWDGEGHPSVHRYAYKTFVGPIPDNLDLDHLCRNRRCCNPDHLEPVSRSENLKRGNNPIILKKLAKERAERTHCRKGHRWTPENIYIDKKNNSRRCKTCRLEWEKARKSL